MDVTATFYHRDGSRQLGPRDHARAARIRGFLARKCVRTRAVSMYGLRTVLSGTLLPARPIALAFPDLMRELERAGFEVGVHGYDHVRWQDRLDEIGDDGIRGEIEEAFEAFRAVMGDARASFAAPGWRTSAAALRRSTAHGLEYRSDTRGTVPVSMRGRRRNLRDA